MSKTIKIQSIVLLLTIILIITATISNAQNPIYQNIVKENNNKYKQWALDTYLELQCEADKDLWNIPYKNARWFTNRFWRDREDSNFIKLKLKEHLFNNDIWEDYLFSMIFLIELRIKAMTNDIYGITNERKAHLKQNLPTPSEIIENIYSSQTEAGVNETPEDDFNKNWERFVDKHPKTSLTSTAFIALFTYKFTKSPSLSEWVFESLACHKTIKMKKEKYHEILLSTIIKNNKHFDKALEELIFEIFEDAEEYLKAQKLVYYN